MPKEFQVPEFYRSPILTTLKRVRRELDPRRRNITPSILDCGPVRFIIPRSFGFCFGVENAIEIAYRALDENPGKQIFLLSEMIHNPEVNADLLERGASFLMDTAGNELISLDTLRKGDIVIVPAFGTTLEIQDRLSKLGVDPYLYNTTCPFVEKVWKRSDELGQRGYSVVVHGKRSHEETRATFSHSQVAAPTVVIFDRKEAEFLQDFILGRRTSEEFFRVLGAGCSAGFDPERDLQRIGVVNQTTMLATETQEIAELLKSTIAEKFGTENLSHHFADTRDTLCYATYENQSAIRELLTVGADLALVVGGFNSSNTSHLAELCETVMPTFYIRNSDGIFDRQSIQHFCIHQSIVKTITGWLPTLDCPVNIAVVSGASCPDATVEAVLERVLGLFKETRALSLALTESCNRSRYPAIEAE